MKTFQKEFRLGLMICLIVALGSLIVGARTTTARASLKTRLAEQRDSLSKLHAELDTLKAKQISLLELHQRCSDYQQQLPTADRCDATIASIKQLADINTLTLGPIRMLSSKPSAGLIQRGFRLQARGSFNAFYSFLTQLETSSSSVVLSSLQLSRLGDGEADLSADVTLQLLFRAADDSEATSTALPGDKR